MSKANFRPRASYDFGSMKRGQKKNIPITKRDPRAGTRALTAAYAFARRYNEACKKKADHVKFAGRLNKTGTIRTIYRVQ